MKCSRRFFGFRILEIFLIQNCLQVFAYNAYLNSWHFQRPRGGCSLLQRPVLTSPPTGYLESMSWPEDDPSSQQQPYGSPRLSPSAQEAVSEKIRELLEREEQLRRERLQMEAEMESIAYQATNQPSDGAAGARELSRGSAEPPRPLAPEERAPLTGSYLRRLTTPQQQAAEAEARAGVLRQLGGERADREQQLLVISHWECQLAAARAERAAAAGAAAEAARRREVDARRCEVEALTAEARALEGSLAAARAAREDRAAAAGTAAQLVDTTKAELDSYRAELNSLTDVSSQQAYYKKCLRQLKESTSSLEKTSHEKNRIKIRLDQANKEIEETRMEVLLAEEKLRGAKRKALAQKNEVSDRAILETSVQSQLKLAEKKVMRRDEEAASLKQAIDRIISHVSQKNTSTDMVHKGGIAERLSLKLQETQAAIEREQRRLERTLQQIIDIQSKMGNEARKKLGLEALPAERPVTVEEWKWPF